MPYRNKTYVAFDGDEDIHYYRLMQAWKQNDGFSFNFYDAHGINYARDSSQEASIKAQLAERMRSTKTFVLLVGEKTRLLRKFVPWEIDQAISRDLPIIVVNLNGKRSLCLERCPARLREELAVHIDFGARIMQLALDEWPGSHAELRRAREVGPYYYRDARYGEVGSARS